MLNSPRRWLEQRIVVFVEEVEAGIVAALMLDRLRQFVEFVAPVARVVDGGENSNSGGWRLQKFAQCGQAVDVFLHGGPFVCADPRGVLPPVVLEKKQPLTVFSMRRMRPNLS